MAVDSAGRIYVIWHDEPTSSPNSNVMFTRSIDGGATFSPPVPIYGIPGGNQPSPTQLVVDTAGTIHILTTGSVPVGGGKFTEGIFYARSSDGGGATVNLGTLSITVP